MRTLFLICFKKRHISQFDVNRYDLVLHFHQRAFATEKKKKTYLSLARKAAANISNYKWQKIANFILCHKLKPLDLDQCM